LHERGEVVRATARTKALTTTLLAPHDKPHLAFKPPLAFAFSVRNGPEKEKQRERGNQHKTNNREN
jgi:hypothetical protein